MAFAVLKVSYQGEVRRSLIETEVSYDVVLKTILQVFPDLNDYSAKYVDEEGDICTLCKASFPDFLAVSKAGNAGEASQNQKLLLKLELCDAPKPPKPQTFEEQIKEQVLHSLGATEKNLHGFQDPTAWIPMGPLMGLFKGMCKGEGKGKEGPSGKGKCKGKGKCFPFADEGGMSSDLITPKMMASVLTCKLPKILPHLVSEHHGQALHAATQHVPQLRSALESLKPLLEKTEGLEPCAAALERAFEGAEAAGEFLLSLVTSLDLLPFERQIGFLEEFFTLHWEKVQGLMAMAQPFMRMADLFQHRHVTCDGCGASPLKGPRFKCRSCEDYDLCADCYSQKRKVKDGQCAEHDFECILMDCHGAFPWMGKGMCQGKAKGKGTHFGVTCDDLHDGCGPMAWMGQMKGFFKGMCKGKGKGKGKQEQPPQENPEALSFPVEVADGRSLQISWMHGEDPMTVALGFAQEFGIQADELATIVDFVRHAEEVTSATGKESKQDEPTKEDEPKQDEPTKADEPKQDEPMKDDDAKQDEPMKDEPKKAAEQNTEATQEPKEAKPKAAEAEEPKKEAVAKCRPCATAGVEELKADTKKMEVQAATEIVHFAFPIMLDDGRELHMHWQSGDDLKQVALSFAKQHGIPEEMVPQMVDFAQQLVHVKAPVDKPQNVTAGVAELKADTKVMENQAATEIVHFSFPIMLDDGRELRMHWQSGDDLKQVALSFAKQHGIPEEMVPQMVDFAQQLVPVKVPVDKPQVPDQTPLQLLKDMGFTNMDNQVLEDLLSSSGNDVAKVVETLMLYQ